MEQKIEPFVFDSYTVFPNRKQINFRYRYKELKFTEKIILPKAIPTLVNKNLLKKVLESLHLMLGINYYKMFCPKKIVTPYSLTKEEADFWRTVYIKGLGEFFYRNKIDFRGLIDFSKSRLDTPFLIMLRAPVSVSFPPLLASNNTPRLRAVGIPDTSTPATFFKRVSSPRFLVAVGGGKDSIVSVEMLKEQKKDVTGYLLQSQKELPFVQKEVVKIMGIDCLIVKREIDKKLFELGKEGKVYKGHIPITAIYSFVGLLLAVIYDFQNIIVSNEKSANFGSINYLGMDVNHQWSKSEEFEHLFQSYLTLCNTPGVLYRSLLRQMSELEIAKKFARYRKYFPVFSSCNKNFKIINSGQKRWCSSCPKCAFNFVILAVFIPKEKLIKIFGKNLLDDKNLLSLYKDLRGEGKMKPFDCVGTFDETKKAFQLIMENREYDNDDIIKNL